MLQVKSHAISYLLKRLLYEYFSITQRFRLLIRVRYNLDGKKVILHKIGNNHIVSSHTSRFFSHFILMFQHSMLIFLKRIKHAINKVAHGNQFFLLYKFFQVSRNFDLFLFECCTFFAQSKIH